MIKESTEARKVKDEVIRLLKAAGHTVYDCTVNDGTSANDVLVKIVKKCNTHKADLTCQSISIPEQMIAPVTDEPREQRSICIIPAARQRSMQKRSLSRLQHWTYKPWRKGQPEAVFPTQIK
mgnify:CR=1 FL=1